MTFFSASNLLLFIIHVDRLFSLTHSSQRLIDAMADSRLRLGIFLSKMNPYFSKEDPEKCLGPKIELLDRLLKNKSPISPFSGTSVIWKPFLTSKRFRMIQSKLE